MMTHGWTINQIKGRLLEELLEKAAGEADPAKWVKLTSELMRDFFEITECGLFLCRNGQLLPLQGDNYRTTDTISWTQIEDCFLGSDIADELTPHWAPYDAGFVCRQEDGPPAGLILFAQTPEWRQLREEGYAELFAGLVSRMLVVVKQNIFLARREKQYRELFRVTEKFYSSRDAEAILPDILSAVTETASVFTADLLLASDSLSAEDAAIRPFDYEEERQPTIRSFMAGELIFETADELGCRFLNAPISGRQGTYGVLRITAPLNYWFSERQKTFFGLLAKTAGNALENARLYDQSHRLIGDLQLINETTRQLNMNLPLEEMLAYLQNRLEKTFRPAAVCFVIRQQDGTYQLSADSSPFFRKPENRSLIDEALSFFAASPDPLFLADFQKKDTPKFPYRSVLSVPLIADQQLLGFGLIAHEEPYYFSFEEYKLLQSLLEHSVLAISNAVLKEQLQSLADRDHLTGLYSRGFLDRRLNETFPSDPAPVFILLDIDDFKKINDSHGHQTGDRVLQAIGRVLNERIQPHGISARWGGEELAVYLPNAAAGEGEMLASELVRRIPEATDPSVTVSIGLSSLKDRHERTFRQLYQSADRALYMAKHLGKNQFCTEGTA